MIEWTIIAQLYQSNTDCKSGPQKLYKADDEQNISSKFNQSHEDGTVISVRGWTMEETITPTEESIRYITM